MKDTAPTLDEIKQVKEIWDTAPCSELQEMNFFRDNRKMTIVNPMTEILIRNAPEELKEDIWKLCKRLSSYAHAPVALSEYRRAKIYADNPAIVDVVLSGLQEDYYPFDPKDLIPKIQGYYYCIAILSQSTYKRDECLIFLERLSNYTLENLPDGVEVLKRNMKVLKADYSDLEKLYKLLDTGE